MTIKLLTDFKEAVDIRFTSAAAITAGDVVDMGTRLGVAHDTTAANIEGVIIVKGRFRLAKDPTLTITAGDLLYFDDANSRMTIEPIGKFAGTASRDAASTDTDCQIDLNDVSGGEGSGGSELIRFEEDFLGLSALVEQTGSPGIWEDVSVASAVVGILADENGGAFELEAAATSEAEDGVLYFGDQLNFDIDKLQIFECRLKIATPGTTVTTVWGMASNHDLDKDTITEHAWFRSEASLTLLTETDDGTNDNDDKDTTKELTTDVYAWFKIDFTNTASVKFFYREEGVTTYLAVNTGTTFDMSNYSGNLQPYFSIDKPSGTGTGKVTIDYVRILCER